MNKFDQVNIEETINSLSVSLIFQTACYCALPSLFLKGAAPCPFWWCPRRPVIFYLALLVSGAEFTWRRRHSPW